MLSRRAGTRGLLPRWPTLSDAVPQHLWVVPRDADVPVFVGPVTGRRACVGMSGQQRPDFPFLLRGFLRAGGHLWSRVLWARNGLHQRMLRRFSRGW